MSSHDDADSARPKFVSKETTGRVLTWPAMVARLKTAYSVPHMAATSPRRSVARADGVWLRAQASAPPGAKYMGAKLFGVGREKAANHLIALFDQDSGKLAAFVDGQLATAFRTAATTAVAIDRLAQPGPVRVAILGSGLEAHHHLEALHAVRPIEAVRIFSPTRERREAFAAEFRRSLGLDIQAADSARAACDGMSVIIAAARAAGEQPILYGDWLKPGQMVASIGSTLPEQREIDVSVVEACDLIVCDTVDEVIEETGDMIAASAAGVDFGAKILSLNEAMQDAAAGRIAGAQLPLYKSVGSGLQDIIAAELALDLAAEQGLAETSGIRLQTRRPPPPSPKNLKNRMELTASAKPGTGLTKIYAASITSSFLPSPATSAESTRRRSGTMSARSWNMGFQDA